MFGHHKYGLAVLRTGRPPRTVVGSAQLAAIGAYHNALAHIDGLLGRVQALGAMTWSPSQLGALQAYKAKRDEIDRGMTLAVQQGNEPLAEAAANAQEALAQLVERDYFDSQGRPKVSDVKTGEELAQEIKDKLEDAAKAAADKFSIPWWAWALGATVVGGGALYFAWPMLAALAHRRK